MAVLRSKKSAVHVVTLLEEMPVQETVDGVAELRSAELPVGAVLVNRTRCPLLSEADLEAAREGGLDRAELAAGLKAAGIEADEPLLDTLTTEAADHARRVALEQQERGELEQLQRPTYELPQLADSVDLGGLYRLAELLTEQGMAG
jgi:hypothetical protein